MIEWDYIPRFAQPCWRQTDRYNWITNCSLNHPPRHPKILRLALMCVCVKCAKWSIPCSAEWLGFALVQPRMRLAPTHSSGISAPTRRHVLILPPHGTGEDAQRHDTTQEEPFVDSYPELSCCAGPRRDAEQETTTQTKTEYSINKSSWMSFKLQRNWFIWQRVQFTGEIPHRVHTGLESVIRLLFWRHCTSEYTFNEIIYIISQVPSTYSESGSSGFQCSSFLTQSIPAIPQPPTT